jgi:hypothetical protein
MTPKFLLIAGNRVVGKDTFFNILSRKLNVPIKRIAFADYLKEMLEGVCLAFFNKKIGDLNSYEKETFRPVLLTVGKLGRELDLDFWVKKAVDQIDHSFSLYVFTDVRYLNEYEFLNKKFPGQCHLLWIDRVGAPPPTSEELVHGPRLKAFADSTLEWPTFGVDNLDKGYKYVDIWLTKAGFQ